MSVDVLWSAWEGPGLEHLRLEESANGVRADSLLITVDDAGRPFRARFVVECDEGWCVTRARIEVLEASPRILDLAGDARGHWTSGGTSTPTLDGCLDVDVFPSPFTNTLPMRRLTEAVVGQPIAIDVAWVALPELSVRVDRQEYTLLDRGAGGSRWRFRALETGFTVELATDPHGLVRDYPGIARRSL
jgi:hypothetical protein